MINVVYKPYNLQYRCQSAITVIPHHCKLPVYLPQKGKMKLSAIFCIVLTFILAIDAASIKIPNVTGKTFIR